MSDDPLPAGDFRAWLGALEAARRGGGSGIDVPCGGCTACCTSSYFVHVEPDEVDTLAHIPRTLLFPAPGLPHGHLLLGYDEQGRCPMLVDSACSIYEHRPRTCRTFDCRVFAAAGVEPGGATRVEITRRVERWRFRYAEQADRRRHAAVRRAATYLRERAGDLPDETLPSNSTELALLALRIHEVFLGAVGPPEDRGPDATQAPDPDPVPDPDTVASAIRARRAAAGPQ